MADAPQTDPLKRGRSTSEMFALLAAVVPPLVVAGAQFFSDLAVQFPEQVWIGLVASTLASIAYILGRSVVKAADIRGRSLIEASRIAANVAASSSSTPTTSPAPTVLENIVGPLTPPRP